MDISSGIFFGTLAMASWGISDFCIAKSVKSSGALKAFVWAETISVTLMFIIFMKFYKLPVFSYTVILLILTAGMLGVISNLSFYKSLKKGQVCVVMPIASCWAIITVMLSIAFLGEKLSIIQLAGIFFAIVGAALVSFKLSDLKKPSLKQHAHVGVEYAVLAAFAYGTNFVIIDILVTMIGWFLTIMLMEIMVIFYLFLYSGAFKKDISFPKNISKLVLMVGILDLTAYLSYGLGVSSEFGSIVAPIAAASPAISIILAAYFFKEMTEINQRIGIVSVLIGLVFLAT